jgi:hypothetical protein
VKVRKGERQGQVLDAGVRLPEKMQPGLQLFPRCANAPSNATKDAKIEEVVPL